MGKITGLMELERFAHAWLIKVLFLCLFSLAAQSARTQPLSEPSYGALIKASGAPPGLLFMEVPDPGNTLSRSLMLAAISSSGSAASMGLQQWLRGNGKYIAIGGKSPALNVATVRTALSQRSIASAGKTLWVYVGDFAHAPILSPDGVTVHLVTNATDLSMVAGASFSVSGERVQFDPPTQLHLVWMEAQASGGFFAEYIETSESIQSWRGRYMRVQRIRAPAIDDSAKAAMNAAGVDTLEGLVGKTREALAMRSCGSVHRSLPSVTVTTTGGPGYLVGGFCTRYGVVAPYGEGQLLTVLRGKDFIHLVALGWRPREEPDLASSEFGLPKEALAEMQRQLLKLDLCGRSAGSGVTCP